MPKSRPAISLPIPTRIALEGIGIYQDGKSLVLDVVPGLNAVLGANGLGKSTLLNLVLYALTGMVRRPGIDLVHSSEKGFLLQGRDHALAYFDGRVRPEDAKKAYVQIEFQLAGIRIAAKRGFIRRARVLELNVDNRTITPTDSQTLDQHFETKVCELSGFKTFAQYAFFVQALQSFGDDHICLFWEQLALSQIFYTLSASSAEGEKLSILIDTFKRADSNVRNSQWQISKEAEALKELQRALGIKSDGPTESEMDRYKELEDEILHVDEKREQARSTLLEAMTARDSASIEARLLETKLQQSTFAALSSHRVGLAQSPLLARFSREHHCPFCGSDGLPSKALLNTIETGDCPLCSTHFKTAEPPATAKDVNSLASLRNSLKEALTMHAKLERRIEALTDQADELERESSRLRTSLEKLLGAHGREMFEARARMRAGGLTTSELDLKRDLVSSLQRKKKEHIADRKAAKDELLSIQRKMHGAFSDNKERIVSRFRSLAQEFIGRPVAISAKERRVDQVPILEFQLALDGNVRRGPEQLSESQRYFVDIALRMTLLGEFVGKKNAPAFLFLDTPEGALDLAYEANAGEMLGKYMGSNNGALFAVFNLNTSDLPRRAIETTPKEMETSILDLRAWGDVSKVQKAHEKQLDARVAELRALSLVRA